jgi:hypothetical protein
MSDLHSVYDLFKSLSYQEDKYLEVYQRFKEQFPEIINECQFIPFSQVSNSQLTLDEDTLIPVASQKIIDKIYEKRFNIVGIISRFHESRRLYLLRTKLYGKKENSKRQLLYENFYSYVDYILIDSADQPEIKEGKSRRQIVYILLRKNQPNLKIILRFNVISSSVRQKDIIEWFKIWTNSDDHLIIPSGRKIDLDNNILRSQTEFIYFILLPELNAVKIGRAKDVTKRLNSLQTACPVKLKLLKTEDFKEGEEALKAEKRFHAQFSHLQMEGEWFRYEDDLKTYLDNF